MKEKDLLNRTLLFVTITQERAKNNTPGWKKHFDIQRPSRGVETLAVLGKPATA